MTAEQMTLQELAKMFDHSLLHPTFTDQDIIDGCDLARRYNVATACVKPYAIPIATELLEGSDVKVCAVAAFPHGNTSINMKVREAEHSIQRGAEEIDVVVNAGKVLGEKWQYVSDEVQAINQAVVGNGALLKVIFENDFLEDQHIIRLCEICSQHQVAFIKTSTGYGFVKQKKGMYTYHGATDHHLKLMRKHAAESVQVKAAGGVRTLDDALRVRDLGATRIGASATQSILEEAVARGIE